LPSNGSAQIVVTSLLPDKWSFEQILNSNPFFTMGFWLKFLNEQKDFMIDLDI